MTTSDRQSYVDHLKRISAVGAVAVGLLGLTACSDGKGVSASSSAGAGSSGPSPSVTSDAELRAVVSSYMRAVMAADFAKASEFVVADQRDIIKALGLSQGPGTLQKMSGDIDVGRLDVDGDHAQATLVGRMCRVALSGSGEPTAPDCVENRDANANNPIFTVQLSRTTTNSWQVSLPTPTDD